MESRSQTIQVLKEFDPVFGDSYFKLRVRLLSRNGRMPVLELRLFDIRLQEFTPRGISFPLASLKNLKLMLLRDLDEVPQLINAFNLTSTKENQNG